ncbi:NPRL2 [Mytilus edulis]|uniref:NPRL2 n=1 Tax=Mytilus edulis TaxID=6550 RepID=A0A8S3UMJ0_MYTED|nr:NPRL2 [Mytilus edulis]
MIKGMCLAEFHPTAGPKIKYQIPEEVFSKEDLDAIHPYIITKPDLKERLITLNTLGKKVIGCPVIIENPKYARNAYIFNLFFVMDSKTETTKYEPVVKKLASYLKQIEVVDKEKEKNSIGLRVNRSMVKVTVTKNRKILEKYWKNNFWIVS